MKPRTKLQFKILQLHQSLPAITAEQKEWAFKHCLKHVGYRTKKGISCLDCGHHFIGSQDAKTIPCPNCGAKLSVETTRKKKLHQREFFAVIDALDGFQINRFFEVISDHRSESRVSHFIWEVAQHWIIPNEKYEVIARNRTQQWTWDSFHGSMEFRSKHNFANKYDILPTKVYPKINCLAIYKRNGFKGNFRGLTPFEMFTELLTDTKAETLLKAGQFDLLCKRISQRKYAVDRFWDSIKICIRSNYKVKDAVTWLDYVALLAYFNKDLRSAKYVCPKNLKQAHNQLVAKKTELEKRREAERKKQRILRDQREYEAHKKAFFGLVFTDKNLMVKVLQTVQEFIDEGDTHKHCLFTNDYHLKKDSLILSARVDGKLMETVEVSLSKMKIVQSRGLQNTASVYNQQILKLVNSKMRLIKQRKALLKNTG